MLNPADLSEPTRRRVDAFEAMGFAFDVDAPGPQPRAMPARGGDLPSPQPDDPDTFRVTVFDGSGQRVAVGEQADLESAVLAAIAHLEQQDLVQAT